MSIFVRQLCVNVWSGARQRLASIALDQQWRYISAANPAPAGQSISNIINNIDDQY